MYTWNVRSGARQVNCRSSPAAKSSFRGSDRIDLYFPDQANERDLRRNPESLQYSKARALHCGVGPRCYLQNLYNKHGRRHAKTLRQRSNLTSIKFAVTGKNFGNYSLTANLFPKIGLSEIVLLH